MILERGKTEIRICSALCRTEDGDEYTGYGFTVFKEPEHEIIFQAEDLSADRGAIEELIRTIREQDVATVHLADLVEDFLS